MRSVFIYIGSRFKQMPLVLHAFTGLSLFMPIFAFGFYIRDDSHTQVSLPKVLLITACCAAFIYGFLQATRWSRPLIVIWLVVASGWAMFQHRSTYSFSDYAGLLLTNGFIVWILYFRREVRDYYARAHKSVA